MMTSLTLSAAVACFSYTTAVMSQPLVVKVTSEGLFTLIVDGDEWLTGGGLSSSVGAPISSDQQVVSMSNSTGIDRFGSYSDVSMEWKSEDKPVIKTSFRSYANLDAIVMSQTFPNGWNVSQRSQPETTNCSEIKIGTDQRGGKLLSKIPDDSVDDCCKRCIDNPKCNAWVIDDEKKPTCFLIGGKIMGTYTRPNRSLSIVRGDDPQRQSNFIASFPSFSTNGSVDLRYLSWGGCQVSSPTSGPWDGSQPSFTGTTDGEPVVIYRSDGTGRALAIAPLDNFFVSGQGTFASSLQCGIRNSIEQLPVGFNHSTIIVGGQGINDTLYALGDVLLSISGKKRTNPAEDFVLSHLGYWTDHGAYYYGTHANVNPLSNEQYARCILTLTLQYTTSEGALLAVKKDMMSRQIPVRYFQWDDWWMQKVGKGDSPGIISWIPKETAFPSGFTDWLGMPLSLYAPWYAANNTWVNSYEWHMEKLSGIPTDPRFYSDLFQNGTGIGMKMFEQDFLCGMNMQGMTSKDLESAHLWMSGMNAAAIDAGVTVQWCMMDSLHALASTSYPAVTNGRGTRDNTRRDPHNIESMGQTGLLYSAMGIFTSRDNVWTTPANVNQSKCSEGHCSEINRIADNAVAVLAGGPYGPSDALGLTDRTIVMRACRSDGVLIRPSLQLATLDVAYSSKKSTLIWAAHDEFGSFRWSYVLLVNSNTSFELSPRSLQGEKAHAVGVWPLNVAGGVSNVVHVSVNSTFSIPAPVPIVDAPSISHFNFAPVLPSGMVILGDVTKWATMSYRRFVFLSITSSGVQAQVLGSKNDTVPVSYVPSGSSTTEIIICSFPELPVKDCSKPDRFGDVDCTMLLECTPMSCTCQ